MAEYKDRAYDDTPPGFMTRTRDGHLTETHLCNMALSYLGKGSIQELTNMNENAVTCSLFYDITRQEVLRTFNWGFAHRIEPLAPLVTERVDENGNKTDIKDELPSNFSNFYVYPYKCIKLNAVTIHGDDSQRMEFDTLSVGGIKVIATNIGNAYADYVYDETNPNEYDSLFITAFTHLLASKIAVRLTGMPQLEQAQMQAYMQTVQQAHLYDSRETRLNTVWKGSYLNARRG